MLDANGWVDSGSIMFEGMDLAKFKTEAEWLKIRGKKIAMVFQDPMTALNPLRTAGSQIQEVLTLHQGLRGEAAKARAIEILDQVGITEPALRYGQYPHELSGGMRQRVVIAIAVACNPRILICDEPTTALDVTIQAQILALIKRLQKQLGLTIIYITHDLGVVANVADTAAVMYAGDNSSSTGPPRKCSMTRATRTLGLFCRRSRSSGKRESLCTRLWVLRRTCSRRSRAMRSLPGIPTR